LGARTTVIGRPRARVLAYDAIFAVSFGMVQECSNNLPRDIFHTTGYLQY
jgi:hypothetical protein